MENPHRRVDSNGQNIFIGDNGPAYYRLDGKSLSPEVIQQSQAALDEYTGFSTAYAYRDDYRNLDTNTHGRPGFTNKDYFSFRPGEAPASHYRQLTQDCNLAYRKVGVIRNIIDLMGDFASQGIRLVCKNKKEQAIYNKWWKMVNGDERSERFANIFYRLGTVIARKITGKTTIRVKRYMRTVTAAPDTVVDTEDERVVEIPCRYVFLDPCVVTTIGGPLASFMGKRLYAIELPMNLKRVINNPSSSLEKSMVSELPEDIKRAAKENKPYPLPAEKISVFYYKKDDWLPWGTPMLEAILKDVRLLEKLKLADMAALDGAISNIRIFKLGNPDAGIAPTPAIARRLAQILQNNVGAGTFDIVWDANIDLLESKTTIHQFLGEEKYKPTLNAIFMGLGIPPTVTGTFGASGTTNNFISLKTLIQRLGYGRQALAAFWEEEAEQVRKSLGLKHKAYVEFDNVNLGDDAAEKQLWIALYDRGLASDEMMRYIFRSNNEMEEYRINRENDERKKGKRAPRAGAFHNPQFEIDLRKIALQQGYITWEQAGVEVDPEANGSITPFDKQMELEKESLKKQALVKKQSGPMKTKKKGEPGQGRPKNSRDKTKRKERTFKPLTKATLEIWANTVQQAVSEFINPYILDLFGHKNMRQLTQEQFEQAENIKFGVLSNIRPFSEITEEAVLDALSLPSNKEMVSKYNKLSKAVKSELKRTLTSDEERKIQAFIYAYVKGNDDSNI